MKLILPDIHGREFWKEPCKNIDKYEKVIFLGDYVDPYDFERIEIPNAIKNFESIIELKKKNMDKVVLLLGNHDMPYYSREYKSFSTYHCRYSYTYGKVISNIFKENEDLFQIAYEDDEHVYTHAGITEAWKDYISEDGNLNVDKLNDLVNSRNGLSDLYMVSYKRGGYDNSGSCIWADVYEHMPEENCMKKYQIFGHTLQIDTDAYEETREIKDGKPIITHDFAMLDCRRAFELEGKDKFNML